jgi:hypothetical protein
MVKAIICCSSALEYLAFSKLSESNLVQVVLAHEWETTRSARKGEREFEGYERVSGLELISRGLDGSWTDSDSNSLTLTEAEIFEPSAADFFAMMNRLDTAMVQTFADRRRVFHYLIRFWQKKLDLINPDFVYFTGTPHEVSDYVLFAVAEARGVQTVMWQDSHPFCAKILTRNWRSPWLEQFRRREASNQFEEELNTYFEKNSADYATAAPPWAREDVLNDDAICHRRIKNKGRARTLLTSSLVSLRELLNYSQRLSRNYAKLFSMSPWATLSLRSLLFASRLFQVLSKFIDTRLALRSYAALASFEIPKQNFVAFFLHYQPEMTVNPMGWVRGDQALAISSIARALPTGWSVVIKEHPSQFDSRQAGFFTGRDKFFYQRLLSIPKTVLVSNEVNAFELIDASSGVSTISGTVGAQALVRNKPVLVFGDSWYSGSPGVTRGQSDTQIRDWVESLQPDSMNVIRKPFEQYMRSQLDYYDRIMFDEANAKLIGAPWLPNQYLGTLISRLRNYIEDVINTR